MYLVARRSLAAQVRRTRRHPADRPGSIGSEAGGQSSGPFCKHQIAVDAVDQIALIDSESLAKFRHQRLLV
jgi:hypothetical protein